VGLNIEDSVVLITGGNTGIGKATAVALARKGARVVIASRDASRGKLALDEIRGDSGRDDVELIGLDLARLSSVRRCAEEFAERFDQLNVLVNNAGIALTRGLRQETHDGLEMQFGVNHVGHFVLTNALLPLMRKSTPARIVNLSSAGYLMAPDGLNFDDLQSAENYSGFSCYGHSKLANIYFTTELARRLEGEDITVNAVHPGYVDTELGRLRPEDKERFVRSEKKPSGPKSGGGPDLSSLGQALSAEEGAATSILVAASPTVDEVTGRYFADSEISDLTPVALDPEPAAQLWAATEAILEGLRD
jgi:NAD(P)-dependent dehydrogenase (short-subunit alcohol dehydrogenase family)